mmetsp:Transcript_463/g.431  ORF Transcript_463/g.431 Transcript_463/m.431 type:complete len:183 (+) Transcript_463:128-676(+)
MDKLRNGCCKECMKAFSSTGKACLCQVPSKVRRRKIPDEGCIICKCHGCNPEDLRKMGRERERVKPTYDNKERDRYDRDRERERERDRSERDRPYERESSRHERDERRGRKNDDSPVRDHGPSSHYHRDEDSDPKLNNFDNSYIGNIVRNSFSMYPGLLGFGIPQRSYSYIHGKPHSHHSHH